MAAKKTRTPNAKRSRADSHRLLERSLRDAEARLRLIIDSVPAAITYYDPSQTMLLVNRFYEDLIEQRSEQLIGKKLREIISAEEYALIRPHVEQVLRGERAAYRRTRRRKDGSQSEIRVQNVPDFDADGKVRGAFSLITDITELTRAEVQLQELNQNLERRVAERTAELEALVREREAFSYSIAHDLRSPLGVISSFSHLISKDEGQKLSDDGRRKLQVIEDNVAHLVTLVDALLALAQVSRVRLERKPIDLGEIAAAAAKSLGVQYPRAQILIGALPQASGDPTLIQQALYNLMDNALKYSARDAAPRVNVGWNQEAQACYVRDNGVGFEMRYAEKLFNSFERLHSSDEYAGSGIGLAIVKRVIERHGGRVWAQSAPGRGSTFYFTLGAG